MCVCEVREGRVWGWKFAPPNFMEQDHRTGLRPSLVSGARPGFRQGTGLSREVVDRPLAFGVMVFRGNEQPTGKVCTFYF